MNLSFYLEKQECTLLPHDRRVSINESLIPDIRMNYGLPIRESTPVLAHVFNLAESTACVLTHMNAI